MDKANRSFLFKYTLRKGLLYLKKNKEVKQLSQVA